LPRRTQIEDLRQRENTQGNRNQWQPLGQVQVSESKAFVGGTPMCADGTQQNADEPRRDALQHGAAAQDRDHGDTEKGHGGNLGVTKIEDEWTDNGDHEHQSNRADDSAQRRYRIDCTEGMRRAALLRQLVAFQKRDLGGRAGIAQEYGGD
jgi:hypothetical protein